MGQHRIDFPGNAARTLIDVLRDRTVTTPDEIAYTFLQDGEADEASLTYSALERRVQAIAAALRAHTRARSEAGDAAERAILVYPPGLDYITGFLGCLYAGVTAVPAYPPDPFRMERTFPRFQAIANDCRPAALLTTTGILDLAGDILDEFSEFEGVERIATDTVTDDLAAEWQPPAITPDSLAFLQYTSGSTANPKGVMLTHRNLLHNLELIYRGFDMAQPGCGVIWLPPYHDMGLIGGILEPLYVGRPTVLMSPLDFLQRPLRWLNAMTRYRATVSGGPNFAYDLCARKVTPEQRASLDLSCWRVAFNGAEPIRAETLARFAEVFAPCGFRPAAFYPCYGLAEATLIASGGKADAPPVVRKFAAGSLAAGRIAAVKSEEPAVTLVGSGSNLDDQEIAIVDPDTCQRAAADMVGEVWVAGDSIAQGYWNRPAESAATFAAKLGDSPRPFLRTGDLGFLQDSELFITGRIKDLIIVDGRNHYPQDIELTVERCHPAIRPGCTAAFAITVDGQERLVVVAEVARGYRSAHDPGSSGENLDPKVLTAAIRRAVAENHDLHLHAVALLRPGAVPKTSSGKIQRRASRTAYLDGTLELWEGSA